MPEDRIGRQLGEIINQTVNDTVGEPIRKYQALPEGVDKNRKRAIWGTGLLVAGVYLIHAMQVNTGNSLPELARFFVRGTQLPLPASLIFYGFAAVMLFGLLWVWVGLRGSRGPRHIMMAFWALVRIGLAGAALWYGWYLNDPDLDPWLQGFYVIVLAASLMALYLATRGTGTGAVRLIQQQIVRQARIFRIGRRRSF